MKDLLYIKAYKTIPIVALYLKSCLLFFVGQKARTVIFPKQQSAMVLENDLADEGIHLGTSHQIFPTE